MTKKRKQKKLKRSPRKLPHPQGTEVLTKTGFKILVKKVGPHLFQDLRLKHDMDRQPFQREIYVPETKATLHLEYTPPEEEPLREEDEAEWVLYHQFEEWLSDFQETSALYHQERTRYLLNRAITIIRHEDDRDIPYEMDHGDWIQDVESVGFEVNFKTRKELYLKVVVLEDEQDFLDFLSLATAEEVTLADVFRAFNYFQDVLGRSAFGKDLPELTNWQNWTGNEPTRDNGSLDDGKNPVAVVPDPA